MGCFNCSIWGSILKREISSGKSVNYKRQFSLSNSARCYDISCSFPNFQRKYSSCAVREQKSQKILLWLTGLVFAMVGCTYAAVPLYRRFCQATGYGGTVQRREVRLEIILILFVHYIFVLLFLVLLFVFCNCDMLW